MRQVVVKGKSGEKNSKRKGVFSGRVRCCDDGKFQCKFGACIDKSLMCDGKRDCPPQEHTQYDKIFDMEDEAASPRVCGRKCENMFTNGVREKGGNSNATKIIQVII